MPRPKSGPRLWLDKERQTWSVIDGRKSVRTGCGKGELQQAKDFLQAYLAAHHTVKPGGDPLIADVLKIYADEHLDGMVSADSVARDLVNLEKWWGDKTASAITAANSRLYIAHRNAPTICRRELGFLNAAIRYWHVHYGPLHVQPVIVKPDPTGSRERWLTRSEAARFLWATRKLRKNAASRMRRFFIIGWYTGTRHAAICNIRWDMVDLEGQLMLRRPPGVAETKKRTPPVRIGARLLSHLRRWQRLDAGVPSHVIHFMGKKVVNLNDSWTHVREFAGLSDDVIPHSLRHSRATHMMKQRVDPWQAAKSLGMSVVVLQKTYGHHHPDWQSEAAEAK